MQFSKDNKVYKILQQNLKINAHKSHYKRGEHRCPGRVDYPISFWYFCKHIANWIFLNKLIGLSQRTIIQYEFVYVVLCLYLCRAVVVVDLQLPVQSIPSTTKLDCHDITKIFMKVAYHDSQGGNNNQMATQHKIYQNVIEDIESLKIPKR